MCTPDRVAMAAKLASCSSLRGPIEASTIQRTRLRWWTAEIEREMFMKQRRPGVEPGGVDGGQQRAHDRALREDDGGTARWRFRLGLGDSARPTGGGEAEPRASRPGAEQSHRFAAAQMHCLCSF